MSVEITYVSRNYRAEDVTARYVKYNGYGAYGFCEVNAKRHDIRQGVVSFTELPAKVRTAALEAREVGVWPFYVEWPLS